MEYPFEEKPYPQASVLVSQQRVDILGIDAHYAVYLSRSCDSPSGVDMVESTVLRSHIQPSVWSVFYLAYSLSAEPVAAASVWPYLELVRSGYEIVHSSEVCTCPHVAVSIPEYAVDRRIIQSAQVFGRLLVMGKKFPGTVIYVDPVFCPYPYIAGTVGLCTAEYPHFQV